MDDLLRMFVVFALVAGNAFFVIGEYAVVTARRAPIAALADQGSVRARAALRLIDDPVRVISTVQVGITALGILTGALGEPLVRDVLGEGLPEWAGFALAFAIVTYLSVVLGELVPKSLTLDRAERLVVLVARPIEMLAIALGPVVWVLQSSAQRLLRPFGVRDVGARDGVNSTEELRALVGEAHGAGIIPRSQEELLHNVFAFAGHDVRDAMLPAAEVAWLDADLAVAAALDEAGAHAHTRYPVGRGSLDRVVGVVHVQDLVKARATAGATVGSVARPALIVPQTKDLSELLRELRAQRQQLAVVADEYGRTAGIVTLEDVLEEIVGEIEDEYDVPDETLSRSEDGALLAAGSMTVEAFNAALGTELPRTGAHTLGGLVFHGLGRRPDVGDVVRFGAVSLVVRELVGSRIARVEVVGAEPR